MNLCKPLHNPFRSLVGKCLVFSKEKDKELKSSPVMPLRLFWSEPHFLGGGHRLQIAKNRLKSKTIQVVGFSILSIFAEIFKSDIKRKILSFPCEVLGYVLGTGPKNKGQTFFIWKCKTTVVECTFENNIICLHIYTISLLLAPFNCSQRTVVTV